VSVDKYNLAEISLSDGSVSYMYVLSIYIWGAVVTMFCRHNVSGQRLRDLPVGQPDGLEDRCRNQRRSANYHRPVRADGKISVT
jgi:hypothetical protein